MLICLFVCVAGCQPGKSQTANSDLPWPDSSNVGSVFKAFASVFTLALFLLWSLFSWFSGQKAGALISLICHANPVTVSVSGARLPEATQRWRAGRVCSQLLQPQLLWSERSVPSLPNFRNLLVASAITVLLSLSLAQYFLVPGEGDEEKSRGLLSSLQPSLSSTLGLKRGAFLGALFVLTWY